jgi:large subunit ribosomal protein L15
MKLNEIGVPDGANGSSRRKGRGNGSGLGKTSGRGQKGAGARKSANRGRMWLEGGNFPLWRATPKRGFKSKFVRDTQIVNLQDIAKLDAKDINAEVLAANGLVKSAKKPVKILAEGAITSAINISVNAFSAKAKEIIEAAGGKAELV